MLRFLLALVIIQCYIGAFFGECYRDSLADSATSTSDERDLSR
jgi:hypothetical protein